MSGFLQAARLDVAESLRTRWFLVYALVFGGIIVVALVAGLTESRVRGFTGLGRLLIIYIQLCMAILPVFILITTVRSVAGDREAGVFEYLLSLPIGLAAWYWGKLAGRFLVVFLPVLAALLAAVAWGLVRGYEVPWAALGINIALLVSLAGCFLGIGILISSLARSADLAQGTAFLVWLVLLMFLDLILIGIMIRNQAAPELVVAISLANPLQVFRTASMALFDPQLTLLGPAAWVILDAFGRAGYVVYGLLYPLVLGGVSATVGFLVFRRGDLP
ncbi:MAG: ABC transporter permease subunit [Hyphomicrobiales bacterium]|nr:ABC transporter permease subunit [Hyphomicrobiales bacterium]MCP5371189.1 ABC transporter permease subunit [Hyphomicrobiales bacterium]